MASKGTSSRLRTPVKFKRAGKSTKGFLERLPSEILVKILSYLDASALYTLGHVNKLFQGITNDNLLWNKVYMSEFGNEKVAKVKNVDEMLLKMARVDLQNCAAGYWKLLFFKTVAACNMSKWKRRLRLISQYTGLPSQTEQVLRNLNITWELTVSDKSGREKTLELSLSQFCETSVYLCFDAGGCSFNYHQISTLQLHGVRMVPLSCPGLKSPGWRSLMTKLDMQALTKKAQVIGQDKLVQLKLLHPGLVVGTWKDQPSIAFIMFILHCHRLVQRSIQGTPSCPYVVPVDRPRDDDVDPQYGLHGYQLHIVLHNAADTLMSERFSQLSCHRGDISDGLIHLTAISRANLSLHTRLMGSVNLPWKCEVLNSAVENCCIMSLTLLDEFRKPFWCVASPVFLRAGVVPLSYDYEGDHFVIHYVDPHGQVKMDLVWLKEQKQFVVVTLDVLVSVHKVNHHFKRDY